MVSDSKWLSLSSYTVSGQLHLLFSKLSRLSCEYFDLKKFPYKYNKGRSYMLKKRSL
jgi:hypothetical protein